MLFGRLLKRRAPLVLTPPGIQKPKHGVVSEPEITIFLAVFHCGWPSLKDLDFTIFLQFVNSPVIRVLYIFMQKTGGEEM